MRKYRFAREHIYIARVENNFSQCELAKLVGVSYVTISRWENGSRVPSASYLASLANVLGVDINYFYVRESAYE